MTIKNNLQQIRHQIELTAKQCDHNTKNIRLIAVSKTKPEGLIEQAITAGQMEFGENYVQEGIKKITYFKKNHPNIPIKWHFIGPLQSNKTKLVAESFDWVQTVDRLKIAQRLSEQRPHALPKLNVLIQINISEEESKSGIAPDEMMNLAKAIAELPNITLRGIMAIPKSEMDEQHQKITFQQMYELYHFLQSHHESVDTLSMGMSDDMTSAIQAGSNMVRVGSAIFGSRQYN